MAANASEKSPDRISAASSDISTLSNSTTKAKENLISVDNAKEEDEKVVALDVRQDMASATPPATTTGDLGNADATCERSIPRPSNIYAPQAHTIYYSGFNSPSSDLDEYLQYVNQEGMELSSPNIYRESSSLLFHTGYGYNPQVPYGAYSPVATPLPSTGGDGQLYSPQQFPLNGPYYQQPLPVNLSFLNSPTPVSQPDRTVTAGMEQQVTFLSETSNSNSSLFGKKPDRSSSHGTFSRGNFSGNYGDPGYYNFRQGFDAYGGSGPWSEWLKYPDAHKSWTPFYPPIASSQPIYSHGSLGHNANPFASGLVPHQARPFHGVDRGYSHGTIYQGSNFGVSYGVNDRGWIANDKGGRRGKGDISLYRSNDTLDYLGEQSRGPRATKPKSLVSENNSSVDSNKKGTSAVGSKLYNHPDFAVEHKDAKFFIIKSYSEDNVHKSIKYGVWASTPNGNRKLDAGYREVEDKGGSCPVFLFFSVNSSAQFCGVAEMIGAVDFDKSVDYWQQDKWSGQFPVKWHFVKDVPNSQFRHIILENNDKKPVTNSRDTQEVNLEQGSEMLTLFKEYKYETSILDDFDFYEERQKAMQERRALQQQQQSYAMLPHLPGSSVDQRHQISSSGYHVNQLQKEFSHMIRLDEIKKESVIATPNGSIDFAEAKTTDKTDAAIETSS